MPKVLATLFSSCEFLRAPSALAKQCISSGLACREYCVAVRVTSATKPRGILHFFVLTEALPRLTARKAATIEPTIQAPISAVTALNDNAPNNSTILSSIRTTSISREVCLKNRRTDCRGACVLTSSRLSNALRWPIKDPTKAVRRPTSKLPSGNYLPSGFWSKTSASF